MAKSSQIVIMMTTKEKFMIIDKMRKYIRTKISKQTK